MKRVAIITINSLNFGNRLQNYALQEAIKALGYDVTTIQRNFLPFCKEKIINEIKNTFKLILHTRRGRYIKFDRKHIQFSKHYASANEAEKGLAKCFDYFVAGSDQVWNPHYSIVGLSDLLIFAEKHQKMSYAASFGVDSIPPEKEDIYKKNLKDFVALSVREDAGAEIIRSLTGREADVVLDPTLLLDASKWQKVEERPLYFPQNKYVLIYTLGQKTSLFLDYLKKLEEDGQYEFYDVLKINSYGRKPALGPAEFLYLVDHADMVLTDSFHATVFSIIFHKPVRTFPREGIDMSSRIVSLASALGLTENITDDGILYMDQDTNYAHIEQMLEKAKLKSIDFLRAALS